MNFNRLYTDAKFLRHLLCAQALADQLKNFELAVGQGLDSGFARVVAAEAVEDFRRNGFTHEGAAAGDLPDAFDDFFAPPPAS